MSALRKSYQVENNIISHPNFQNQPNQLPLTSPVVRQRVKSKPKKDFYTLKMLMALCGFGVFALMFTQLYIDAQINQVHYQIQSIQTQMSIQSSLNEQLQAEVANLSQYSRIHEIATAHGLQFHENIVTIISNR